MELLNAYKDSINNNFEKQYRSKCLQATKLESFTVTHNVSEYHYTLYYYDQAGNLVKTIPPAGVTPNRDAGWLADVEVLGLKKEKPINQRKCTAAYWSELVTALGKYYKVPKEKIEKAKRSKIYQ